MDRNPDFADLHTIAKRVTTENLDLNGPYYFCAILKEHKTPHNCTGDEDFLWVKVKGIHTVQKVKSVYPEERRDHVSLALDGSFPDPASTIESLDSRGDKIVVFWAVDNNKKHIMSSRQPLQPVDLQTTGRTLPPLSSMRPIKPEPGMDEMSMSGNPSRTTQSGRNGFASPGESPLESPLLDIGFEEFQRNEIANSVQRGYGSLSDSQLRLAVKHKWNIMTAAQRGQYTRLALASQSAQGAPRAARLGSSSRTLPGITLNGPSSGSGTGSTPRSYGHMTPVKREAKHENESPGEFSDDDASDNPVPRVSKAVEKSRLQKLLGTASPEVLESEVEKAKAILGRLAKALGEQKDHSPDAQQWLQQVEGLQKQVISTPTIIGVVGNTGCGKSSTINALLDEERLLPTNCMRACTAVVTEVSWNASEDENQKYRAAIEFIRPEDWEKELKVLFQELLDGNGEVSRDCANPETEAGIAYAKIKAVYPRLTKETMSNSSVEELMAVADVKNVLGTVKSIAHKNVDIFYQRLNRYVDSKEKTDKKEKGAPKEKKEKGAAFLMEYWPLIKVVKIFTKASALSTGATLVDLPGVQDSNAARAAVAQGYMKQCTGLFVVAPINRAVDDKAAKSLLGETFKRQLKYDGTYSRVTFICSKTDDISNTEAAESLGIQDEMSNLWEEQDDLDKQKKELETKVKDLQDSKAVYGEVFDDADENLDTWEELLGKSEKGETVFAPKPKPAKGSKESKKRKRSESPQKKKSKKRKTDSDDEDDDFIDDDESMASEAEDDDAEKSGEESGEDEERPALTEDEIQAKIDELKVTKKEARRERVLVEDQIKEVKAKMKTIQSKYDELEGQIAAKCISGRNNYSKGAIQQDFAQGIKELDQENAAEEDEENFDPEVDIRDYEEVARSLPVFCVSSRGYQKLCGRLKRDKNVAGFKTIEETEIPQLQAHCRKLTEEGRASNCRRILNSFSQLTNSLSLWASNDGSGMNLTEAQRTRETENLKKKLGNLEKAFEKEVESCIKDLKEALHDSIFGKYPDAIQAASTNAPTRCAHWSAPVNKFDRAAGGYYWATFRAIVRRNGVYSNAQGLHDWNAQLCEPIMKRLATEWEKVFQRKFPAILNAFARGAKQKMHRFHAEVEKRCFERGVGHAGISMVKQQLVNYETSFLELAAAMNNLSQEHQREASRGFQPVVELEMVPSYEHCANESGSGCFARMKRHMIDFIETNKNSMFPKSCDAVQGQLKDLCRGIEAGLSDATDETYVRIHRDYMQIVGGVRLPAGQVMSKAERALRSEICEILEEDNEAEDEDVMMTDKKGKSAVKQPETRDEEHAEAADSSKSSGGVKRGAVADTEEDDDDSEYDDDKENQVAKKYGASSDYSSD